MPQKNRRSHKKRQITKFRDSDKTELELWYWTQDSTKTPEVFRPCSQNESKQISQHSHAVARSCPQQQESRETKVKMDRCDKRRLPYDERWLANRYSHGARQKFLEEVRGRAADACRWDIAKEISQVSQDFKSNISASWLVRHLTDCKLVCRGIVRLPQLT